MNITRCDDCGEFTHPPREICRHCQSENVAPFAVSGRGDVDTYTINYQAWAKDMEVPFVIARVALNDALARAGRAAMGEVGKLPEMPAELRSVLEAYS